MLDYEELKKKSEYLANKYKTCVRLIDKYNTAYIDSLRAFEITRKLTEEERQELIELAFFDKYEEIGQKDYIKYVPRLDEDPLAES